jgi:hypothetical protein
MKNTTIIILIILAIAIILQVFFFKDQIYIRGTSEYAKKEQEFKIQMPDAIKILRKYEKNRSKNNMYTHAFIKNNTYVFSQYIKKTGASLEGIYINGYTGAVHYVHSNKLGPFNQHRLDVCCGSEFQAIKKSKKYITKKECLLQKQLGEKETTKEH